MPHILKHVEQGELPPWWADSPPLLVFSGCRWSSTGGGQRPVQLAREWRKAGREVLYVSHGGQPFEINEGIICGNLDHFAKWLPTLSRWQGDCFCGFPAYWFATHGKLRHWHMVLDICDDWEEFLRINSVQADCWVESEVRVAFRDAQTVTHSAKCLEQFCLRYGARRTLLVPNGGPAAPVVRSNPPADMRLSETLNVVFCGALWGKWVDWDATRKLAQELAEVDPQALLHVIGGFDNSCSPPPRPAEPNMRNYGERPYAEAMRMIAACDVGLIPFRIPLLCKAVDANKWYDYLAGGLPVVCTDVMEDLRGRPYTYLCEPEALSRTVLLAAQQGRISADEVARMTALHSWQVRAQQMLDEFRKPAETPRSKLWRRPAREEAVPVPDETDETEAAPVAPQPESSPEEQPETPALLPRRRNRHGRHTICDPPKNEGNTHLLGA